jgi:hypothetical protein
MNDLNEMSKELQTISKDALTHWTDEKRKDFVSTFKQRANVAKYVMQETAGQITIIASNRKFISNKHTNKIKPTDLCRYNADFGGRSHNELVELALERARATLKGLPALNKAVQIINPELSKKIESRDRLIEECKKLAARHGELSEPIVMSEVDQKMTVAAFRSMVKDTCKKRDKIALELNEVSKEALEFESQIDKELYSGIPGLSDAVVKVIQDHYDKVTALDQMTRRVEEQVMFGDSDAALELLKGFEKDESKVSDEIKAEFDKALLVLKLKPVSSKQLKGK